MSNIIFDPKTGLGVPDTASIYATVAAEWQNALGSNLNTEPSTPQGQLITTQTAMIAAKNTELVKLAQQFNPLTAEGVWQDAIGYIYFLTRNVAQATTVVCQCRGLVNTIIPANSVIEDTSGNRFVSISDAVIPQSEVIEVTFEAQVAGVLEVPANSVNTIISVVPGWDTVNNELSGISGRLTETQAAFERRRYASVAKNAHGTVSALYGTLADINNVIDVVVLENRTNAPVEQAGVTIDGHSVFISIFGGTDAEIAQAIYLKLGAGCGTTGSDLVTYVATEFYNAVYTYNITRPTQTPVFIKVVIRETERTPATIIEDVRAAIVENFNGLDGSGNTRVAMADTLYASRFYTAIINAGGTELISCEVGFSDAAYLDDIFINADVFPVIESANISVELVTL